MKRLIYLDSAATTRCSEAAAEQVLRHCCERYGNPSSAHGLGQQAARSVHEARVAFAGYFKVGPEQVIFTGSGSEADNLAIQGVAMGWLARKGWSALRSERPGQVLPAGLPAAPASSAPRIICSATEHAAVRRTALALADLGFDVQLAPVDSSGQVRREKLADLVTPETLLVSVHQVNNIMGAIHPVEDLARLVKLRNPRTVFHTDAVQGFSKLPHPTASGPVDLVSISGHKIEGPKGIGALVALNADLLRSSLRPIIWGGDQEGGLRSGTQNAGLIAGFRVAAEQALLNRERNSMHARQLRARLDQQLRSKNLLGADQAPGIVRWNSPQDSIPQIVSLSVPGYPSGPLARFIEERGCLVSTGSACSSSKQELDPVLREMGLAPGVAGSAIRVSFSPQTSLGEVDAFAQALHESIQQMGTLLSGRPV